MSEPLHETLTAYANKKLPKLRRDVMRHIRASLYAGLAVDRSFTEEKKPDQNRHMTHHYRGPLICLNDKMSFKQSYAASIDFLIKEVEILIGNMLRISLVDFADEHLILDGTNSGIKVFDRVIYGSNHLLRFVVASEAAIDATPLRFDEWPNFIEPEINNPSTMGAVPNPAWVAASRELAIGLDESHPLCVYSERGIDFGMELKFNAVQFPKDKYEFGRHVLRITNQIEKNPISKITTLELPRQ